MLGLSGLQSESEWALVSSEQDGHWYQSLAAQSSRDTGTWQWTAASLVCGSEAVGGVDLEDYAGRTFTWTSSGQELYRGLHPALPGSRICTRVYNRALSPTLECPPLLGT